MKSVMRIIAVFALITCQSVLAAGDPAPMSREVFDQLMQDISNWGRWGVEDQIGTLNLITPEKRKIAAALVVEGLTVSMALDLNKHPDERLGEPFEHEVSTAEASGHVWAWDSYAVSPHGYVHSHIDGLPHFSHKGKMYNNVPFDSVTPSGAERLGIENIAKVGIFSRGVLVDLPRFMGVDYLPAGTAITAEDLEAWEQAFEVNISSGDVLLIRTGRWRQVQEEGLWNFEEKSTGVHASLVTWFRERGVAVIGSDGVSDVNPSGVEGLLYPLHELVLVGLGMPILDNLDLDEVARVAEEQGRSTFLFVAAPLRVQGGTGAPLNPLAVF